MSAAASDIALVTQRFRNTLWALFGGGSLAIFSLALFLNMYWALAIPVVVAFLCLSILRPYWIFGLLLVVMPFSIEYQAGGFGTDLPSEPLALLTAGLFVVYMLLGHDQNTRKYAGHPIMVALGLHLVWIVISTIFSYQPLISAKFLVAKLWYLAAFVGATAIFVRKEVTLRQVFWMLHLPVIITIGWVMYRHAQLDFSFIGINKACSVVYRNHVNYGVFITMWLPWQWMALLWYRKGSLEKTFIQLSILLTLAAIYFSYTRGAWVAVAAIPAYYLVVRNRLTKWAFLLAGVSVIIGGVFLYNNNHYLEYAPNYDTTIFHGDFSDHISATFSGEDMSTMERVHRWVSAARMSAEEPLTGFGPGNFVHYYKPHTVTAFSTYISDNEEMSTVHNYFLLMLTEQGWTGLLIFIFFTAVLFFQGENIWHSSAGNTRRIVLALLLCILVFYTNNIFSDLFEANKLAPLFFISIAVLVNIQLGIWKPRETEKS